MGKRIRRVGVLIGAVMLLVCVGCAKKNVQGPMAPGLGGGGAGFASPGGDGTGTGMGSTVLTDDKLRALGITTEEQKREYLRQKEEFENEDVHFDFDAYTIREDAKAILNKKAEFLKRYPPLSITIEGHCDERGTNEYNLALGERRSHSAWQYLVNMGIDPERMQMISYGEERPVVTGHDEASWAKNRRAHFVIHF